MIKMSAQLENIVTAYKKLSKIPSVVSGSLNNADNKVSSKWSIRNLDKGKPTKYLHTHYLDDKLGVVSESDFGVDASNMLLSAVSPSESYKAVIREERNSKDNKTKQHLEIWSRHTLTHAIDLSALDIHGDVYADSEFGNLDWSKDESSVVYVAERKLKKTEPYIKRKVEKKLDGSGEDSPKKGEEFVYRQDWGEQLVGKHLSVIVVCRIENESFNVLEGLPESWCPGQVRFAPDGKSVVGVAWETEPRRLGLIFCTNRPSYIFNLTLDGNMTKLSAEGLSVRSPRFTPSGDLIWLQRVADGPHHACHAIVTKKSNSSEVTPIIDIVQTEARTANNESFYGVYCQSLPKNGFSKDGKRLIFSTPQQNEIRTYVVDIDGGRIVDICNRSSQLSTSVLDVKDDVILAACSSLTKPGELYAARLPPQGQESTIKWVQISTGNIAPIAVTTSTVEYMYLDHENSADSVKSFTALYMAPEAEANSFPLVVWPHGGPHSGFVNAFSLEAALFSMLGFAQVQVNYRGSIGAGQASVDFLPKRVGDADVKDCKLATDAVLRKYSIDDKKLCLTGGSHGGFLVTHLVGQYPETYAVCVSRNPVIDVATMFNSTDIPDWCAAEAGFQFSERGPVSEDQLLAMTRCSPLAHVHRVKTPTALMLGSEDKRVPHYQGLEFARRLKANGVKTRIYMYEDNHSLSSQSAEMDNVINSAAWFFEHL